MYKQYKPYQIFLVLADILLTTIVFILAVELRPFLPGKAVVAQEIRFAPWVYPMVGVFWHVIFALGGVYDRSRLPFFLKQVGRFTSSSFLALFVLVGFLYFTNRDVSRVLVIYFCITNYLVLFLIRYWLTTFLRKRRDILEKTNVLIVGGSATAVNLAGILLEQHGSIYEVVGFVDDDDDLNARMPVALIGKLEDVPRLVEEKGVQLVLIALPEGRSLEIEKLITGLYPLPVRIYVVPDLLRITFLHSEVDSFGEIPLIGIREPAVHGPQRVAKRILDLTVSTIVLLLTWPIFIAMAIAVKLDSPGPALYVTRRVGENGKIFKMFKFRTMIEDAEKLKYDVVRTDFDGRPVYKSKGDPRVTGVGRILRRTSLDELPQLINVLKGEMSLVGPRPEQPFVTEDYESSQWLRTAVPPGVTGLWQVSGRSDLPLHLDSWHDIHYARNYSLLLDIKILLRTVWVVIQGKGAY